MTEIKRRGRPRATPIDPDVAAAAKAMTEHPNWDKSGWSKSPDDIERENYEHSLGVVLDYFKANFPDDWEALRLCPLQHGLDDMMRLLKD